MHLRSLLSLYPAKHYLHDVEDTEQSKQLWSSHILLQEPYIRLYPVMHFVQFFYDEHVRHTSGHGVHLF